MNNERKADHKKVFDAFSADEQTVIKDLWEKSKKTDFDQPEISDDEMEQALAKVHQKTGGYSGSSGSNNVSWRWVLAAAVVLLMFGAGILFMPRTVTAPHGEIVSVNLPDGSIVELNSGSELRYSYLFSVFNREVRLNGEAFFSVKKGKSPFKVSSNGAVVRVTGTKFNVRSWNDEPGAMTRVAVLEGRVQLYPKDDKGQSVSLNPGQFSKWIAHMDAPTEPQTVDVDRLVGWRDHKLIFDEEPLSVIFKEMERRFDVSIKLEATGMKTEKLTTYYNKPESVESILADICRVKGLNFSK
jgi:ferric-dicitrate binding protein FerR (iron transport regulator)